MTALATKSTASLEVTRLRVELAKREWGWAELSKACSITASTLRSQCPRNFPSRRLRLIIEHRGIGSPLWSTTEDFKRREQQRLLFGELPELLTRRAIGKKASAAGLPGWSLYHQKSELINALTKFLTRRPGVADPSPSSDRKP